VGGLFCLDLVLNVSANGREKRTALGLELGFASVIGIGMEGIVGRLECVVTSENFVVEFEVVVVVRSA